MRLGPAWIGVAMIRESGLSVVEERVQMEAREPMKVGVGEEREVQS